jgi:hypothetical protein
MELRNSCCRPQLLLQPSSHSTSTGKFKIGGSKLDDICGFDGTTCFHFVARKKFETDYVSKRN